MIMYRLRVALRLERFLINEKRKISDDAVSLHCSTSALLVSVSFVAATFQKKRERKSYNVDVSISRPIREHNAVTPCAVLETPFLKWGHRNAFNMSRIPPNKSIFLHTVYDIAYIYVYTYVHIHTYIHNGPI